MLSSESISPQSFYEKRGYGYKRFEKITANSMTNSILAYSKIPVFSSPRSDREEYPFYLAVPKKNLAKDIREFQTNNVTILQTDASINISWKDCFFIVENDDNKKKLIAGPKRSLEAKHLEYYARNVYSFQNYDLESFEWSESILDNISDFKNVNRTEILKDQRHNKIKGCIYGYVAGRLKEQPIEFTQGKRYFQDFINSFSALMNDLSSLARERKKVPGKIDTANIRKELKYLKELTERINILFVSNEQNELESVLKSGFNIGTSDIEFFQKTKFEKTNHSVYSIIADFIKNRNKELFTIDELLNSLLSKVNEFLRNNTFSNYNELDSSFNLYRSTINEKIRNYLRESISSNAITKIPFQLDDLNIKVNLNHLNNSENEFFQLIIDEFLSRLELSSSDEIAQQRMDILQEIAENIKKLSKGEKSNEVIYLRRLYQSLMTVGVRFKVNESDNVALQSLSCFLSRYSERDKLQDFMEKNQFNDYGLTYSIWGAAYGYANMSKILLEPLMSNEGALNFGLTVYYEHDFEFSS